MSTMSIKTPEADRLVGKAGQPRRGSDRGTMLQRVLFVALLVILVALIVPPTWSLLRTSFTDPATGEIGFDNYASILPWMTDAGLLLNTGVFAVGSTILAFIYGSALAWLSERTNVRFRRLMYITAFISFAFPGVIQAMGWVLLLGPRAGALNVFFIDVLNLPLPRFDVNTMYGMVIVEAITWAPVVFLLMVVPFRAMDSTLEEAARVSGGTNWQVMRRITLRLATPAGLAVLLISIVRNIESFEVPAILGLPGGVRVLTTQIFVRLQGTNVPNYGEVSAYSMILILLVIPLLWAYHRATRGQGKYATITGKGMRPSRLDLGKSRWLGGLLVLSLPVLTFAPILILAWASFLPFYQQPSLDALSSLTLENYRLAFVNNPLVVQGAMNTAIVGTVTATVVVLLTALSAWVVVRSRIRGRIALDILAIVPLAIPGIVLAVGMLQAYVGSSLPVYGTLLIIILAYVTRFVPYTMRFTHAGLLSISKELEESASVAGAGLGGIMGRILFPLMLPALFTGWVYAFLLSARELPVAILLQSSGNQLMSAVIWALWENGQITVAAAISVVFALVLTVLGWILHRTSEKYGVSSPHG